MIANVAVDVLLGLGVACELLCCVGVLAMRSPFTRLHYSSAAATVGPFLVLAAVLVREHVSSSGLQSIAAVGILFLVSPLLTLALARAARRVERGTLEPTPAELERGTR